MSDKFQHFIFGIVIASFVYPLSTTGALAAPVVLGALKEFYDLRVTKIFSKTDLFATSIGGFFLVIYYQLFNLTSL